MTERGADSGRARANGPAAAVSPVVPRELRTRVERIAQETKDARLTRAVRLVLADEASLAHLNTCLMDNFRVHRNLEAYSLLYDLNHREFLVVILKRLRLLNAALDPNDVLQDVFVSIFRYPHKFRDERDFSFRNWSYSIIRNTILKHLRTGKGAEVSAELFTDSLEDEHQKSPLGTLVDEESRDECGMTWMLLLAHYLRAYESRLNEREQRALELVEVNNLRYRDASVVLGIKLENLKMVICRARKKIFRTIAETAGAES